MSKIKLIFSLFVAVLVLSGCTINFGGKVDDTRAGGLFKSIDFGNTWQQKGLLLTTGTQPKGIFALDILSFAIDPTDSKALYFGTLSNGLFYSYDAGESWQQARGVETIAVRSIAVDPVEHCRIYLASYNRVYRSEDCGRVWKQVYADTNQSLLFYSLVVDPMNHTAIYSANSRGDVMKSEDMGVSWRVSLNIPGAHFYKLAMSPFDSRTLMVISDRNKIYRTTDAGQTWVDIKPKLGVFSSMGDLKDIIASSKDKGMWLVATTNGLYRTVNDGENWLALKLLTPNNQAVINSVAMSPVDSKRIYYLTDNAFYSSADGGDNWTSRKLPTPRRGFMVATDPKNEGVIYLGPKVKN